MIRYVLALMTISLVPPSLGFSQVNVYYDFEGDLGSVAVDKLTDDGAQNGRLLNNVSFDSEQAPFGTQAVRFEAPDEVMGVPPFSTLEIPETTFGPDFSLTVAMHVDNREMPPDFTRLFTSFQGTGPIPPDRSVFFDFDPTGESGVTGLRGIANGNVIMSAAPPNGMSDPGYHHYAMTLEDGDLRLYFDGVEVAGGSVGSGYSNIVNVHIGEDPHDGGGTADEQLIGNIDEVLVLQRALSGPEIALLADGNPVPSIVEPLPNERAIYYNFEGDIGSSITDKFTVDGAQDAIVHRLVEVDQTPMNALLGSSSGSLRHPAGGGESIFSQIDVGQIGNLGSQFTLSAVINVPAPGGGHPFNGLTRLFSSFRGTGPLQPGELVFDFDPNASVEEIGMRLVLPDGSQLRSPVTFTTDEDHTLTATYDDGFVALYLDGDLVASDALPFFGDVDLGTTPLKIGEDNGGILNENLIGIMDDVLILTGALSASQVEELAELGGSEFLGIGGLRGDFDNNGVLDAVDLDALVLEITAMTHASAFDLTSDGLVDGDDLSEWRTIGAEANGFSEPILEGDANLDGVVSAGDLNAVGVNWLQSPNSWTGGDFDASGDVGAADLNLLGINWQKDISPPAASVPEPSGWWLSVLWLALLVRRALGCQSRSYRCSLCDHWRRSRPRATVGAARYQPRVMLLRPGMT